MSDISATADFSADVESSPASEGLGETTSYEAPVESSTPSDSGYDAPDNGSIQESAEPIESLFELDGTPITLDEAKNGYLRQSDYTKKTQELAEMRSRLAEAEAITEALRSDPISTLNALSEAFGVDFRAEANDPFADMDPEMARISVLEQKIAQQENAARQATIDAELSNMHQQFGEFNDQELFAHAIKGNFQSLQSAYADMNFGRLQTQLAEMTRKQNEEAARTQAKREASVVHDGGTRATGAVSNTRPVEYSGVREAFLAAKKALGVS
jgi:hypothetical protein